MQKITPTEFYNMCHAHNWLYELSGGRGSWEKGTETYRAIKWALRDEPSLATIHDAFFIHHFERGPKPVRPIDRVAA